MLLTQARFRKPAQLEFRGAGTLGRRGSFCVAASWSLILPRPCRPSSAACEPRDEARVGAFAHLQRRNPSVDDV